PPRCSPPPLHDALPISPLVAEVMLINPSLLCAVQSQLVAAAVTATLVVPPAEPKPSLAGLIVKLQPGPVCVTVCVWPAMVNVPRRVVQTSELHTPDQIE